MNRIQSDKTNEVRGVVVGDEVIPYGEMVGGEKLEKMMEALGITRDDLKPVVVLSNDEMVAWIKEFGGRLKALGESLSERGLDDGQLVAKFYERAEHIITQRLSSKFEDATDVTSDGGAVYEHSMGLDYASLCLDLTIDALEFAYTYR